MRSFLALHVFELDFQGSTRQQNFTQAINQGKQHEREAEPEQNLTRNSDADEEADHRQDTANQAEDTKSLHPTD